MHFRNCQCYPPLHHMSHCIKSNALPLRAGCAMNIDYCVTLLKVHGNGFLSTVICNLNRTFNQVSPPLFPPSMRLTSTAKLRTACSLPRSREIPSSPLHSSVSVRTLLNICSVLSHTGPRHHRHYQ